MGGVLPLTAVSVSVAGGFRGGGPLNNGNILGTENRDRAPTTAVCLRNGDKLRLSGFRLDYLSQSLKRKWMERDEEGNLLW